MENLETNNRSSLRTEQVHKSLMTRRTEREFSSERPDIALILKSLEVANSAPSGANLQPWHFALIQDDQIKKQIRLEAEKVEYDFYHKRASKEWLDDLKFLGTNHQKPFLEEAPFLIAVFYCPILHKNGEQKKTYFSMESTGLATGFLLTALHEAGLSSLTYTPKPSHFLNSICQRPKTDRAFMLIVAGYPKFLDTPLKAKQPLESRLSVF